MIKGIKASPEILTLKSATSTGANAKRDFLINMNDVPQIIDRKINVIHDFNSDGFDII